MKTKWWAILLIVLATFLTTSANILYKIGANKLALDFNKLITNWFIPVGFILYCVAGVILIISLKHGDVSVLYPILATSYIWVTLLSKFIFNDTFNTLKTIGIVTVLVGVVMLSIGGNRRSAITMEEPL